MAVDPSDVTARAKEFASLGSTEIQTAIDDAALQVNATIWGAKADLATIYLAAHTLAIQNPSLAGASGAVQSESVGDVSRTYAVGASTLSDAPYGMTRWGREYIRLRAQLLGARVL